MNLTHRLTRGVVGASCAVLALEYTIGVVKYQPYTVQGPLSVYPCCSTILYVLDAAAWWLAATMLLSDALKKVNQ